VNSRQLLCVNGVFGPVDAFTLLQIPEQLRRRFDVEQGTQGVADHRGGAAHGGSRCGHRARQWRGGRGVKRAVQGRVHLVDRDEFVHDGGEDWIWFVIDGSYYPGNTKSISFFQGTTQTAGTFGMPVKQFPSTGTATFQVVLDRTWPTANRVIDSNTVSCAAVGSGLSVRFSDGDATYDLKSKATLV
jgi:hypothetical protein